jgi:acyl-homoserine-lactone acylase
METALPARRQPPHRSPPHQSPKTQHSTPWARLGLLATALGLAGCASTPPGSTALAPQTALLTRTTHGVAHITAPDFETLAYGVAYAHAQDNVCQTADALVGMRSQRSQFFGAKSMGALGLRALPNEVIDGFVALHMDDTALAKAWGQASPEAQALARGYVAGYNRFLQDHSGRLPAACQGQPWVQPMTLAEYRRLNEVLVTQAGITALADGVLGAQPPAPKAAALPQPELNLAEAREALREAGLYEPRFGSNAWALGKDSTANGSGLLLGNPHFPWQGVNRFWQLHLTIPGQLDVMGASIGHTPLVQIGFNRDIAWSHTVSTGKRFTLHELKLVPGDATSYLLDGQPVKMTSKVVGGRTYWRSQFGPIVVNPRAGLLWTADTAYAIQDANTGNTRSLDTWLGINRASSVEGIRQAQRNLGIPWVNTIAADRHGNAYYADVSVVPDVDGAQLKACAPSARAAALLPAAGLVVLDGSRAACDWRRDPASPVPGLTPIERMPVAVRSDWLHNSNDSFFYSHPAQTFDGISPLVGDAVMRRPRTRAGLVEIPELLARGKATPQAVQQQLFANRNHVAEWVLPDLLAACPQAPSAEAREGCAALAGFNRVNDLQARGAHLFREFWRFAGTVPGAYREAFSPARPTTTPMGLKMADANVAPKVWAALETAVKKVREAGFALDAPLGEVQRAATSAQPIGLHGGDEIEGVLNNLGDRRAPGIHKNGLLIDYGTSYVQTVTFDARGPVAEALLTYGQSTNPASPHATDQTRLYAAKQWPRLPFHADDVARQSLGPALVLLRP